MKTKTKSILIIVVTLLVGIGIGAFGASAIWNNRINEDMERVRTPGGFSTMMKDVIQPHDEAQWVQIQALLEQTGTRFSQLRKRHGMEYRVVSDSMRTEIGRILTPEQQQRLNDWFSRDRRPEWGRGRGEGRSRTEGRNRRDHGQQ